MRFAGAVMMLVLLAAGGRAWGGPPALDGMMERAAAQIRVRAFAEAAVTLRQVVSVDPGNRKAREMLAFALESTGDLEGERRVRSALAAEYPDDPRVHADHGRVLERSGDDGGALRAYARARQLSAGESTAELDAAVARMKGRTALEIGTPRVARMSDPDGTTSSVQAGVAVPLGARHHVVLRGTHHSAEARGFPAASVASDVLVLNFVHRGATSWMAGPSLHVAPGSASREVAVGGTVAARSTLGRWLESEWRAGMETPWDEAVVAVVRGGRTTAAEGHLYAHALSRRLMLQAGARRRRLSIQEVGSASRPRAWQTLWVAGADAVLWRKPGDAVRGEMLDEALVAPATLSSAATLSYRRYDVSSRNTPAFASLIGLVPRARVDEVSVATSLASPPGNVGLELRGGLSRDAAREARGWRAGGALIWAPRVATRISLGYERASEAASGLVGQRRTGWMSLHVDL